MLVRLLLFVSIVASAILILGQVELRLPRLPPKPPTLLEPVLASAKSL